MKSSFSSSKLVLSAVLLLSVFFAASPGMAQEITGAIVGVVKDSSGAVIAGAVVSAINQDTGSEFRATTDELGNYQFPIVRAGRYRLTVESTGFQKLQRNDVIVNTTEKVRLDVALVVGEMTETVTVTAETPLLQSEIVTLGQVVEQNTIQSIPLATRNFTQILGTSAGVVGAIFNADRPGTGSDSVSVNGARRGSNNLLVDGVPTTNPLNNAPDGDGTPSIEFLSEFKVLTSLYSPEYGRNSGSVINVTTRSGSNDFHGTVYEFLRNTSLNARPFFSPTRGQNNQNQFGGNVGGRIRRDSTFFFAGWESSRQLNANSGDATIQRIVPTPDQRRGIFGSKRILDPSTGQPFPNNTIPQDRLNPISLKIQDTFIPLPNFSSGANNFFAARSIATDIDQYTVRIDHRFGSSDSLFGRWFESFQKDKIPFGQGLPGFGRNANREKHSANITHTHLFSPTLVLEGRFGLDLTDQFISFENQTDPTSVGLRPLPLTNKEGMPRINITNYLSFGNEANWSDFIDRYSSGATMTWIRSQHNFKFGVENQTSLLNPKNALESRGVFNYNGAATGDEYADFLLSIPRNKLFGAGDGELKMREATWSGFFADDWKVTPNVTLDAGLRYEAHFQAAAHNLNMVNWWPENYRGIGSLEASGIVQGGVNGVPRNTVFGDWNNFMPRLGVAWRLGNNWVVRAGAGLYFDQRTGQIAQQAFSNPPTFTRIQPDCTVAGSGCSLTQPDNWTYGDPQHDPTKIPFPTRPTDALVIRGIERDVKTDNAWQYNFNMQRQLPSNLLLETSYVGTKGTHLMARRNFNPLIPQPNGTLLRQYAGFGDLLVTAQNGDSTYHSLQITLKRRAARSTFQLAYTASKTLSDGDEGARFFTSLSRTPWNDWSRAKGPANFDRPQRLALTFVHELPNRFTSRIGKGIFNDWSVNGFLIVQSGEPLTVFNRDSGLGLGGTAVDPTQAFNSNVVAGVPLIHTSGSTKENLKTYINKDAWIKAPRGTYGSSGRGMFRGPGQWNLDFSVFKDFKASERFTAQFRTEFFNLFNHANFGNPTVNLDSASFGQIDSTSVNARLVQFALKLKF